MKLVIATRNKDKFKEIKEILKGIPEEIEIVSLFDFPNFPKIVEDGKTLEENAIKKAKTAQELLKLPTIGEDTGLEVEYLNGAPGVYSARFAGPGCSYSDNNEKLLSLLEGVPFEKRKAKFRCVVCFSQPSGEIKIVEGAIDGFISTEPKGTNGFGYDPVFFVPEYKKTFAELPSEIKNKISHRAKAFQKAKEILLEFINKS